MKLRNTSPQFVDQQPGSYYTIRLEARTQTRVNVGEYQKNESHPIFDMEMVDVTHPGSVSCKPVELGDAEHAHYILVYEIENRNDSFVVVTLRRRNNK
ncbi:MAG TPA: hypothetical protein VLA88_02500 [Candidatus Saccharimonadales bacterium]|nr:hypothetical protein [Candidatus Saccharimonadales bacterium]